MKKHSILSAILAGVAPLLFAETNALIEVKLFKDWVIKGELNFCNLAIKNTGTDPILLAKTPFDFYTGQLHARPIPHTSRNTSFYEEAYKMITIVENCEFFNLSSGETQVYEGRKFYLNALRDVFLDEISFTVSIYLGKGDWLDSEPLTVNGVVPDSVEQLTPVGGNRKMEIVTYKNERWLYYANVYPVCPLSLTNKIHIEPHDGKGQFKIWDGDKSMIFSMYPSGVIAEGLDEHNVLGKWTRERKQRAEADNAEVRRKKAEAEK